MNNLHFPRDALRELACAPLTRGELEAEIAEVVAELAVRTDEPGDTTHGISMAPYHLRELKSGKIRGEGRRTVLRDHKVTMVRVGNYLPGHWLMSQALETCMGHDREASRGSRVEGVRLPEEVWTRVAASAAAVGIDLPEPVAP